MAHILVVDDSLLSRRMVVDALRGAGHEITEAVNGELGLESFRQCHPDCVVTDLLMPIMSGQELLKEIRELNSTVPVIVATADIQKMTRDTCTELGVSAFLQKPVQPAELLKEIDSALSTKEKSGEPTELNETQLDALTEVINIGVGRAANSLSELASSPIRLAVPKIHLCGTPEFSQIAKSLDLEFATMIQQEFDGPLAGQALLGFSKDNAFKLARIVGDIHISQTGMDEELCGVLEEISNIVLNAVIGSLANLFDCQLNYRLPKICSKPDFSKILLSCSEDSKGLDFLGIIAETSIEIESCSLSCSLLVLLETEDIKTMLNGLTAEMSV